jgi:hypothetical protein
VDPWCRVDMAVSTSSTRFRCCIPRHTRFRRCSTVGAISSCAATLRTTLSTRESG